MQFPFSHEAAMRLAMSAAQDTWQRMPLPPPRLLRSVGWKVRRQDIFVQARFRAHVGCEQPVLLLRTSANRFTGRVFVLDGWSVHLRAWRAERRRDAAVLARLLRAGGAFAYHAAASLVRCRTPAAMNAITAVLEAGNPDLLRTRVIRALGLWGDPSEEIRLRALHAEGLIAAEDALSCLTKRINGKTLVSCATASQLPWYVHEALTDQRGGS